MESRKHRRKEENRQEKHWKVTRKKNEQYEDTIYTFGLKLYFARKYNLEKVVYSIKFYLQFLCVAGYFKQSNDNIHNSNDKYRMYNIIQITHK